MRSCPNLNCTAPDIVELNGDIVGNGVIAAYLISAFMTLFAGLYGYLSDSLPEWYLNDTDKAVISSVQTMCRRFSQLSKVRTAVSFIGIVSKTIKSFIPQRLRGPASTATPKLTREERQEAILRFILSLSDQQLVTGLAILVGAIANQCTMSVYELQISVALAWFSATTHLATLDFLQDYFMNHGIVRNWRVLGMTLFLLLLMFCFLTAGFMGPIRGMMAEPVGCIFYINYQVPGPNYGVNLVDSLTVVVLILLAGLYLDRTINLYCTKDSKHTKFRRAHITLVLWHRTRSEELSRVEKNYICTEYTAETVSENQQRLLQKISQGRTPFTRRLRAIVWLTWCDHPPSFLSGFPSLAFMVAYGLSSFIAYRWPLVQGFHFKGSMEVGQITPLLLLILPALAVAEVYYEAKLKKSTQLQDVGSNSLATDAVNTNAEQSMTQTSVQVSDSSSARCFDPEAENHQRCVEKYDQMVTSIQRLQYRRVKELEFSMHSASTDGEIASIRQKKCSTLTEHEVLLRSVPYTHRFRTCLVCFKTFLAILVGIGLNGMLGFYMIVVVFFFFTFFFVTNPNYHLFWRIPLGFAESLLYETYLKEDIQRLRDEFRAKEQLETISRQSTAAV